MKELIANFTKQLEEAIKIGEKAQLSDPKHEIKNILISGLGGSGIGGSIAAELLADKATLPITVKKDYFIPAFVNENTLVIISS
jgi:glucose/mannose-6-phosphate isomerase